MKRLVLSGLRRCGYHVVHDSVLPEWLASMAPSSERAVRLRRQVLHRQADMRQDEAFMSIYRACREFTMTSMERMYALYGMVRHVAAAAVPGDCVECGVWRGGSMMLMAHTLTACGDQNRDLYLYDTYKGLPKPDPVDVDFTGTEALGFWQTQQEADHNRWCYASLDEVRTNMASTGYPPARVHFVEGLVQKTIPDTLPARIAVLRLDTDFYASTVHELEHLYPRLVSGGVLVIDDYGEWQGQRKGVDEYFARIGLRPLLHRVDRACRVMIKP